MKQNSGIYIIKNTITGKVYIGSAVRFNHRWRNHLSDLRLLKHHSRLLQRAYNKYGEASFVFEVLEYVEDKENLITREQHYLDLYQSYDPIKGFNISPTASSSVGVVRTQEQKDKISQTLKGRKLPKEVCERMSKSRMGRVVSAETRGKISKANLGNYNGLIPNEARKKVVYQFDLWGNFIAKYDSITAAALGSGVSITQVSNCCAGLIVNRKFAFSYNSMLESLPQKFNSGKLTRDIVLEIRSLHPSLSYAELAKKFNIAKRSVFAVVKRETWKLV